MINPSDSQATDGIIPLFKPTNISSAKYVYRLRRIFGIRKVGHAGSLDPFADGVLIGCLGRGTKLTERLMNLPKSYRTTLRLGVTNATFDTEQPFEPVPNAKPPEDLHLATIIASFSGHIEQIPPTFSAVKINGIPSYHWARKGKTVDIPPRKVHIYRIDVIEYRWPLLRLEIQCGRGTYIRSLARDIGKALGCGACCETLRRSAVGPFGFADAVNLFTAEPRAIRSALISYPRMMNILHSAASNPQPERL